MNKKAVTELCTPLAIVSKYPIKKQGSALNSKELSKDRGRAEFYLRTSLFNKYLSNDSNFRRVHLVEQYL